MTWFDVGAAFIGAAGSAASAKSINRQSLAFAREQMQNKHQWEVADLKKAGLNPILSATGGMGGISSAPNLKQPFSGQEAQAMAASVKDLKAGIKKTEAETSLIKQQQKREQAATWLIDAQALTERFKQGHINAQTSNVIQDTILKLNQALQLTAEYDFTTAKTVQAQERTNLLRQEVMAYKHKMHGLAIEGKIDQSDYGEAMRYIDRSLRVVQTVSGAVGIGGILKELQRFKYFKNSKPYKFER